MKFPPTFVVRSVLGIFPMSYESSKIDDKVLFYTGTANGFDLDIEVKPNKGKFKAFCVTNSEVYDVAETKIKGAVVSPEELPLVVGRWLDEISQEIIEDVEKQVKYFETPNGNIAYFGFNDSLGGTPAIFVHGGPGGDSNPRRARSLMLDRPVFCYDQLGCGMSDPIPDLKKWKPKDYAAELASFIDFLGYEKVILIGASWGAGLCALYAETYGCDKIEAMVLPSPFFSGKIWSEDQFKNLKDMSQLRYDQMMKAIETKDKALYHKVMRAYNKRYLFSREQNRPIGQMAGDEPANDIAAVFWGPNEMKPTRAPMKNFNVVRGLSRIKVPVLLMVGDSDEVRLDTMLMYRSKLKDSRLAVVPHAGHALAFEQPGLYKDCIVAFLEENSI